MKEARAGRVSRVPRAHARVERRCATTDPMQASGLSVILESN